MWNAIVTSCDQRYLPAACALLSSCWQAGRIGKDTCLFLIAESVPSDDLKEARQFLSDLGISLEIIPTHSSMGKSYRISSYYSFATYIKLHLDDFFDDSWDRVLYLDADTRVMAPLNTIFKAKLGDNPLGAVHDFYPHGYLEISGDNGRERLSFKSNSFYFNSGVLLFDWRATRHSGLLRLASKFASDHPDICKFADQDALNKVCEASWTPLDPRWNFMNWEKRLETRFCGYILHYIGKNKPWQHSRFGEDHRWYYNLLHSSPWPRFVEPPAAPGFSWAPRPTESMRYDKLIGILIDEASGTKRAEDFVDFFSLPNLDEHVFDCRELPSSVECRNEAVGRISNGAAGFLVYGPHLTIAKEGRYFAELSYRTRFLRTGRVGVFDVTATRIDGENDKCIEFRTLGSIELSPTWGRWSRARVEFDTNGLCGMVLETRVIIEDGVRMTASQIRTWQAGKRGNRIRGSHHARSGQRHSRQGIGERLWIRLCLLIQTLRFPGLRVLK